MLTLENTFEWAINDAWLKAQPFEAGGLGVEVLTSTVQIWWRPLLHVVAHLSLP